MRPMTEEDVLASFVNAEADELRHAAMPHDFVLTEWDHLDFLAWRDPKASSRGYVVTERDGRATGIVLRISSGARVRSAMCNLCHTMQPGNQVALFSARRAGEPGRKGDAVGTYICADLSCHENVRLAMPLAPSEVRALGYVDKRIDGTKHRMERFVEQVLGAVDAG